MAHIEPALPPIVGYTELEAHYGWNKRTLQRWVRAGKLPRPITMPGGRVAWLLTDMEAFIVRLRDGLIVAAVTDPSKLAPEQVAPTMRELGARLIGEHFREKVAPQDITLRIEQGASNEETTDCRAKFLERLEELCGHFGFERASYVAASIFPALRERYSADGKFGPFLDADHLRECCIEMIDDEKWAAFEKAVAAQQSKAS